MNENIDFCGTRVSLMPSGAFFWPSAKLLVVSDLHLGKSERIARRSGPLLPPYETSETLLRLAREIDMTNAQSVLCLGDSFDDQDAVKSLDESHIATLQRLQSGRQWIWIEGNHDPGPLGLAGTHLAEYRIGPIVFRHIAAQPCERGEISGHFHPKARVQNVPRPCFIVDENRMILPAFGVYTGGLSWTTPELRNLFSNQAIAYLTGRKILAVPVPPISTRP